MVRQYLLRQSSWIFIVFVPFEWFAKLHIPTCVFWIFVEYLIVFFCVIIDMFLLLLRRENVKPEVDKFDVF